MDFALFALLHLFIVLSPGPTLIGMITFAVNFGFKKTFPFVFGVALGNLIITAITVLGLSELIFKVQILKIIFYIGGGMFLIYFGINIAKKKDLKGDFKINAMKVFKTGFIIEVSNPKSILLTASLFAIFIKPESAMHLKIFASLWYIFASILYEAVIIFFCSFFKSKISKYMFYFNLIFGVLLVIFGSRFIYFGIIEGYKYGLYII